MRATYTTWRSVAMTPQLRARLQQLFDKQSKDVTGADLIRQAIREFLDRQEDISGSRAHFRKTFQTRIDTLDETLTFRLDVLLALVALTVLLVALPTAAGPTAQEWTPIPPATPYPVDEVISQLDAVRADASPQVFPAQEMDGVTFGETTVTPEFPQRLYLFRFIISGTTRDAKIIEAFIARTCRG